MLFIIFCALMRKGDLKEVTYVAKQNDECDNVKMREAEQNLNGYA